jgi:hypothetical protein
VLASCLVCQNSFYELSRTGMQSGDVSQVTRVCAFSDRLTPGTSQRRAVHRYICE